MRTTALYLLLFSTSCFGREEAWVEKLVPQLQCGMSLPDVQNLTAHTIKPSAMPELGTHQVDGKRSDLWLGFRNGGLVSVISGTIDGLTSIRLSPKRNLCTRELTFFLSIEWVVPLQGADVFLDGKVVEENTSSGLILEVSSGDHELRVVKEGYEPIVKHLRFEAVDPGRRDVTLTSQDLHPTKPTSG
jgi:hypothetical protein